MLVAVDHPTALRLLRIYGINAPVAEERLEFDHSFDAGIAVTIDGVSESKQGPNIRLKIGRRREALMAPVTELDAENLVRAFRDEDLLPDGRWDHPLAQLLVKCSKLYVDNGLGELHLLLYLTPQGYRTHAVYMMRSRKVPVRVTRGTA
jgi:hypothetical protein